MGITEKQRHDLAAKIRQLTGITMVIGEGQRISEFRPTDIRSHKPGLFRRLPTAGYQPHAQQ
jgi:hypothetical protein